MKEKEKMSDAPKLNEQNDPVFCSECGKLVKKVKKKRAVSANLKPNPVSTC